MLAAACQMFMGKSEGEIAHIALETLEGHQRAIIAHLTVEVGFFSFSIAGRGNVHANALFVSGCLSACSDLDVRNSTCPHSRLHLLQEIYKDRKKFSEQVFKVASSDLVNMGISVVSYTLKDVHDDQVIFLR